MTGFVQDIIMMNLRMNKHTKSTINIRVVCIIQLIFGTKDDDDYYQEWAMSVLN